MSSPLGKQGIQSVALKDRMAIYDCWMPFLKNGGLFIPTTKEYELGDEMFVLLTLADDGERLPVAGKVVWINPKGIQGGRAQGVGVHFNESNEAEVVKTKIESHIAGMDDNPKPTHTM